jgi:hypothetical protein
VFAGESRDEEEMTNDIIGWRNATMAKSITVITSKLDLLEFRLPRRFASTGRPEIRETCRLIETSQMTIDLESYTRNEANR